MKLFSCQACGQVVYFENTLCLSCGHELGYHAGMNRMLALQAAEGGLAVVEEPGAPLQRYCANREHGACNWLVAEGSDSSFCRACQHNRLVPDLSDPGKRALWKRIEVAKRRLIYSLMQMDLPMPRVGDGHDEPLIFDFPAEDIDSAERVITGHASGVVTIALSEADDGVREMVRLQLGEEYRTLLGHFRHESGHYYWNLLVRDGGHLESCRALFGDDRADYGEALHRHYRTGAPQNWNENFVSPYATMHPWEDWAETWAHYLHIVDTLETAGALGMRINPLADVEGELAARVDFDPYHARNAERLLHSWVPLTVALNTMNRSMGHGDTYPFTLPPPVRRKLGYVHDLVSRQAAPG